MCWLSNTKQHDMHAVKTAREFIKLKEAHSIK